MELSHVDPSGQVRMVDISKKPIVKRTAVAVGAVYLGGEAIESIKKGLVKKGDPLACARVAAIMAAKRTADLIPLCHPLPIDQVSVDFEIAGGKISIESRVVSTARTGVEMEALTSVSIAALTIYDMCKAVDRDMTIGDITLKSKTKEPV
ncbi:MAG: cyclic pyranopterin monophosphate synthase MoaC [Candidatus Krumholzibacteria bacterium]|nr:cyclic pyranopterin monophosphate synthase MoaC [Candidatus Krumholzibacteria bacterium]